jgi:hypothetical protein
MTNTVTPEAWCMNREYSKSSSGDNPDGGSLGSCWIATERS